MFSRRDILRAPMGLSLGLGLGFGAGSSNSGGGDIIPPSLISAAISGNGLSLTLTYSEPLSTGSVPATGAFSLAGTSATVSAVGISGSAVTLTVSTKVFATDTVTLSYTPGASPIKDLAGNNAAALVSQAVDTSGSLTQQFASAQFQALSQANFFSAVDGTDGTIPKDPTGGTWVFFFQNGAPSANLLQVGVVGSRGYSITITSQVPQFIPQGGTAVSTTSQAISSNRIGLALTITGGNVRTSVSGNTVTTHSVGAITAANAGDTLRLGSTLDTASVAAQLYCAAFFPSVLSDANLQAVSNIANNDNRFDYSAVLALSPSIFLTAKDDWDGSAASFVTRGSSPITLHKNGSPTRATFTEERRQLARSEMSDGGIEEIVSGSGINTYRRHGSYAKQAWSFTGATGLEFDVISGSTGGVGVSALQVFKNNVFQAAVSAGAGLLPDSARHIWFLATASGTNTWEVRNGPYPDSNKTGYAIQAIRTRTSQPATLVAPTATRRLVAYGDSLTCGVAASGPSTSWIERVTADYPGRVSVEAFGGRALLVHDTDPAAWAARMFALAHQLGTETTVDYVIFIGTNDAASSPSTFDTALRANVDALRALDASASYTLISVSWASSSTDFGNGPTMRANMSTYASSIGAHYVDGSAAVSQANVTSGVHWNDAGHLQMHDAVKAAIGY